MKQILHIFTIAALMLLQTFSIGLPLVQNIPRCMLAFTNDDGQTIKLDIHLPQLKGHIKGQAYKISVYDTQSGKAFVDTIESGRYRKQIQVNNAHVYRLCFSVLSNRKIGTNIINYNVQVDFSYDISSVKIPENLLKNQDTKNAYIVADKMQKELVRYNQFKERKKYHEGEHFLDVIKANDRIEIITYIELLLIVLVGLYQFFMIRRFLLDKQYM